MTSRGQGRIKEASEREPPTQERGRVAGPGESVHLPRVRTKSGAVPVEPPARASSRGRRRWPRVLAALLLVPLLAGVAGAGFVYWKYSRNLPSVAALATYVPPVPTRVYAKDGQLIGEFHGEERRYVLEFDDIPKQVVNAFVAAEDSAFFEHSGVDYVGILRAMIANIREKRLAQGASTITQQVARSFLLTREKSFERKIKEALLAYRIEANFTKEHILYLYLNQVYLGEGAYGVQSAAQVYFDKDARDLTLAETAILAGLLPAPSRYSPLDHFNAARERQLYVLRSMLREGYIDEAEAKAAEQEDPALKPRRNINLTQAPYAVEEVRRNLVKKYGDEKVLTGGLQVYTTIDYALQQAARAAVRAGVEQVDRRIGWRGPEKNIPREEWETWLAKYETDFKTAKQEARPGGIERFGPPPPGPMDLEEGAFYKGIAIEVADKYAIVRLGSHEGVIPLKEILWAYSVNPKRNWKWRSLDKITRIMKPGDLVEVKVLSLEFDGAEEVSGEAASRCLLTLRQYPAVEGSLFSYSPVDGAIYALVGGYDFSRSEFDRPYQALRQMGSAFKPLIYAAALDHPDKMYTPATILLDAPITMHMGDDAQKIPGVEELWKPANYDQHYLGEITLRRALYMSRNTVAVKLLADIGVEYAYEYVKKLGIESPVNKDTSMVLGSSSVTLVEMCRAYSAFASGGYLVEPVLIERVVGRNGDVLEQRPREPEKEQAIPASTAYIMTHLLQDVVRHGTGAKALQLGKITAGKTGTTNDFVDASYIGYTPEIVTGVWVGYDQPTSMGYGQAGGDAALPFWIDYMKAALEKHPPGRYPVPKDVVFADVDPKTGKLANEQAEVKVRLPFLQGEAPVEAAPAPGQVGLEDFLSLDQGF